MSNPTARRSRHPAYWLLVILGGAAGFMTWGYDYEFFLNAGGPETPISDAIRRATGTEQSSEMVFVFWPAIVLVFLGALGGILVFLLFAMLKAAPRTPTAPH